MEIAKSYFEQKLHEFLKFYSNIIMFCFFFATKRFYGLLCASKVQTQVLKPVGLRIGRKSAILGYENSRGQKNNLSDLETKLKDAESSSPVGVIASHINE